MSSSAALYEGSPESDFNIEPKFDGSRKSIKDISKILDFEKPASNFKPEALLDSSHSL